jgi:hypothetical protein
MNINRPQPGKRGEKVIYPLSLPTKYNDLNITS